MRCVYYLGTVMYFVHRVKLHTYRGLESTKHPVVVNRCFFLAQKMHFFQTSMRPTLTILAMDIFILDSYVVILFSDKWTA